MQSTHLSHGFSKNLSLSEQTSAVRSTTQPTLSDTDPQQLSKELARGIKAAPLSIWTESPSSRVTHSD